MRHLATAPAALLVLSGAAACGAPGTRPAGDGRPVVVAAFYPLAYAAGAIGGDLVEINDLTPDGVEPHDLELSADQVRALTDADLIVYLGGGFQPAIEDVVAQGDQTRALDVLPRAGLLAGSQEAGPDPHVWLDPTIMASIARRIGDRLADIDPSHAPAYTRRAAGLTSDLERLDREFAATLEDCKRRELVTSHAAFGYLAARYDLTQIAISGIDPESEPSPGRLADVAGWVNENGVTTIFFEELATPDVAETLADETGAGTDMLSPLESAPESGDYIDAMTANLTALSRALACR